jgi:hypothetical protein
MQLEDLRAPFFPSPREAAGRNQGWGVAPHMPLSANLTRDPPPPTPPRHALTRAEGGEEKASSIFKQPKRPNVEIVIASEAKQSILPNEERMDCFVASAPRNDVEA